MTKLEVGTIVGRRYRLDRELTRGGMGLLWAASHLVTKRRVAVKFLRAGRTDDAASRARFLREARTSCAVEHPAIVPVLDVVEADGAPALIMELLEGESLRERLERTGPLGVREACTILSAVADALGAAHEVGIVHRDIKPENVFLVAREGREPTVRVLDFGIAKTIATEEKTAPLTESGAMLGTPYYMSPEQAFGERDVSAATDAWALGIVLHECLTGERPTQADNLGQVIKRITQEPMASLEERAPSVPPALASLARSLLERDRQRREVDMARVARVLRESAETAAVGTTRPARTDRRIAARVLVAAAVASVSLLLGIVWNVHASRSARGQTDLATLSEHIAVKQHATEEEQRAVGGHAALGARPSTPAAIGTDAAARALAMDDVDVGEAVRGQKNREASRDENASQKDATAPRLSAAASKDATALKRFTPTSRSENTPRADATNTGPGRIIMTTPF